jgi:hypothetical protein
MATPQTTAQVRRRLGALAAPPPPALLRRGLPVLAVLVLVLPFALLTLALLER